MKQLRDRGSLQAGKREDMLVSFLNSFMSYLVLMAIILVVAGVAMTIGITMAKKKSAGNASAGTGTKGNE